MRDVLVVGALLCDEEEAGQDEGHHVLVGAFLEQRWRDAEDVDALRHKPSIVKFVPDHNRNVIANEH